MSSKNKRKVSGVSPAAAAPSSVSRRYTSSAEFNPDYTHVKTGLKRIAAISGSFVVILVVLSFFLK